MTTADGTSAGDSSGQGARVLRSAARQPAPASRDRRIRILHVLPSLERAGAQNQLLHLAEQLPRERFELHVCALHRRGTIRVDLERQGVPAVSVHQSWPGGPLGIYHIWRHIRAIQPDIVHTWGTLANTTGRIAAIAAGVQRLVATERGSDSNRSSVQFLLDRLLARKTQRLIVHSAATASFYADHGVPAEKIVVVPVAVEPPQAAPVDRRELLSQLGLPDNVRLVGAVGPLVARKRLKELVWAIDQVNVVRGGEVHLLLIGDGPDRRLLEHYRELHHIAGNVHFLGQRDDVPGLLPVLDAFWLASIDEDVPDTLLEAMAAGVPVIAIDTPANRALVTSGESGYLVPVHIRSSFARYTDRLFSKPELAERFRAAGRERAKAFAPGEVVQHYAALYEGLLRGTS